MATVELPAHEEISFEQLLANVREELTFLHNNFLLDIICFRSCAFFFLYVLNTGKLFYSLPELELDDHRMTVRLLQTTQVTVRLLTDDADDGITATDDPGDGTTATDDPGDGTTANRRSKRRYYCYIRSRRRYDFYIRHGRRCDCCRRPGRRRYDRSRRL